MSSKIHSTKPWMKLLYIKQDYPDNYVDKSFLKQMKKNVNVRHLTLLQVVGQSFRVSQQMSVMTIFVATFMQLYENVLDPSLLIWIGGSLTAIGFIIWKGALVSGSSRKALMKSNVTLLSRAILFITLLFGLTPILKNLTKDISDDSIWAMSVSMFLSNLLFHDYGSRTSTHTKFPDSLSINAAMFGSVLLASRLSSNLNAFSLLLLAIESFALFPIFRRSLRASRHASVVLDGLISAALFIVSTWLCSVISPVSTTFYIATMMFVTWVGPDMLIRIQKYKSEIRGPWDEAVIINSS